MNQRNQDRFGSSSQDRDQDRSDRGRSGRSAPDSSGAGWREGSYRGGSMQSSGYGSSERHGGSSGRDDLYRGTDREDERFGTERHGTQGYGMGEYGGGYGTERGSQDYGMQDDESGRGRFDRSGSPDRSFGSSLRGDRGQSWGDSFGGSRNGGWNSPSGSMGYGGGQGMFRGSNDHRSQSYRGGDEGYGMQGSSGFSSTVGGGYGMRNQGGMSGYGDVSDYGRGGGWGGQGGGMRSGIDYGAASYRGNQGYARQLGSSGDEPGWGGPSVRSGDDRGFGDRVEDWGHRAKEGIKELFGGPKNYKRSDERIREDVCDRLQHLGSRGHLDPSDIEVTVKDGEVTLSGTVPQRDWKHRAEDLAEAVSGVKEVENRIRVQKQDLSSSTGKSSRSSSTSTTSGTSGTSSFTGNGNTSTTTAKS